ncbi:MAG: anti-sigma factor family protein [Candidatus Aminicenantales bacterium]
MKCRTALKHVPDFLNGALSAARSHDLEQHLETCRKCRRDAEIFRDGLIAMRKPDVAGGMDFTEAEWTAAIRRATAERPVERIVPSVRRLRPAFGYALGVFLVGAAVLFGVRRFPWLIPVLENRPAAAGATVRQPEFVERTGAKGKFSQKKSSAVEKQTVPLPQSAAGDVPSFTWISPDSGLEIVWFVNDNIQLEE